MNGAVFAPAQPGRGDQRRIAGPLRWSIGQERGEQFVAVVQPDIGDNDDAGIGIDKGKSLERRFGRCIETTDAGREPSGDMEERSVRSPRRIGFRHRPQVGLRRRRAVEAQDPENAAHFRRADRSVFPTAFG